MTDRAPAAEGQAQAPEAQGQATWYDTAPDEVKGYIQNKGWDDPIKAVTSYQELEKFRGANEKELIRLPKDPNAEGAYDEIYNKLGRPDKPEKYSVEGIQIEGIDFNVDEDRLNVFRPVAHAAGVSQKQFEALVKADAEYNAKLFEAHQKQVQQAQEAEYKALQSEWGKNAAEREELARRGLKSILPQGVNAEEITAKIEAAIGTAATLKLFANVGDKLAKEDKIPSESGDRPFGYTREQALADKRALMDQIKGDPKRLSEYNQGKGPDVEKLRKLTQLTA